ncbi:MAG TPA: CHAT domain-containing protein [Pyrinomonadaceae bacterium]|nr:CHAT domain-containing protein [Pyrinomonadaceae bacterium]
MTRTLIISSTRYLKSRHGALHLVLTLALAVQFLPFSSSAQESSSPRVRAPRADARKLNVDTPAVGELAPGESHIYLFSLDADQFARVVVEQHGVDLSLLLRSEAGVVLSSVDEHESTTGSEDVTVVAEAAGVFRLAVRAEEEGPTAGQYTVRLAEVRPASPHDRELFAARKFIGEARRLISQRTAASRLLAIEKFKEAAQAFRRIGERRREASATNNVARFYALLGEKQKALEYFERALALWREAGNPRGEAETLHLLGHLHNSMGEPEKALDVHRRALQLRRAINDPINVAKSLDSIGMVYVHFGDARRALDYYEQALAMYREQGARRREPRLFGLMGEAHETLGNLDAALEYQMRALSGLRAQNNLGVVARTLHRIGHLHAKRSDLPKALAHLEEALAIHRTLGNLYRVADTLTSIGEMHYRLGDAGKALEHLRESLALRRPGEEATGEAAARYWIARVLSDRGETKEALSEVAGAVKIVEKLRTRVASQELRASFFATVEQYYELYADLLMRLHAADPAGGHDAAALAVSERARARSLLDLLAEARADIRRGVDQKLLTRERALQQRLNATAENYATIDSGRRDEAQITKEVAVLTSELDEARAEIRRVSPRYAALVEPRTLSLADIQQLLDDNTLLIEYKLGENRSFLWAVTRNDMKSFVLPGRAKIEGAARRLHELLTERNLRPPGETPEQRRARLVRSEEEYAEVAGVLSRMLLTPAASMLGRKRLVIIADGALHYVPFGALPEPQVQVSAIRYQVPEQTRGANHDAKSSRPPLTPETRYVIQDHEVGNLPSASVLAGMRKDIEGRRPAPRSVAVLADPVFDRADARVVGPGSSRKNAVSKSEAQAPADLSAPNDFTDAALDSSVASGSSISRLPFTRREALAILASSTDGRATAALDFRASRATAMGPELSQFRYIHFATHGLLNSTHPQLSGIVLSLVDESGRRQDGYLRLHEIFNLDLPAELVVLSACQTGLGKELKGEGLIGLTRGFMYAGSPRVIASLWKVDDAATVDLMAAFYRGMLKEGLAPAAALRRAQVEMLARKQRQSPYYWAAFVLQGEWK